jgi:hypothetical protein
VTDATTTSLDAAKASRSSVLFALGQLSSDTAHQNEEIAKIPDRVFERLNPRLELVERRQRNHEGRISSLERQRWTTAGGVAAIVTVVTIATGLHHFHILL